MDRAEVIRLLAELREAGEMGSPRWSRLMESIRTQGPIHDPEWSTCTTCGAEFDAETGTERLNGTHKRDRCWACYPAERVERERIRQRKRYA